MNRDLRKTSIIRPVSKRRGGVGYEAPSMERRHQARRTQLALRPELIDGGMVADLLLGWRRLSIGVSCPSIAGRDGASTWPRRSTTR
jgi:hypothetical protein